MTNQEFIEQVAKYVQKYAAQYGIKVHSPTCWQFLNLDGAIQTCCQISQLFGLKCGTKWTGKSVNMTTQEEYSVGTLITIKEQLPCL